MPSIPKVTVPRYKNMSFPSSPFPSPLFKATAHLTHSPVIMKYIFQHILLALTTCVALAQCRRERTCCDVLVLGADGEERVGLNCGGPGVDCGYNGKMTAVCTRINRLTHVGHDCDGA
ncbi:hypothetical protein L218DRAFT_1003330 [Marasmius fiardii PR-910]|nr:hypothetical protein L218DRAFT_1003330 [Marasmius fiardii PR-910]